MARNLILLVVVGVPIDAAILATANWLLLKLHPRWISEMPWHKVFVGFLPIAAASLVALYFHVPSLLAVGIIFLLYKVMFHCGFWDIVILGIMASLLQFVLFFAAAYAIAAMGC